MTILTIETSTDVCSAALTIGGVPIAAHEQTEGSNHAALLPVYIEQLLGRLAERKLPLEAVAISEGPGSYTGLRIGVSTAKGLCYGKDVQLIPVPTTEVLCAAFAARMIEEEMLGVQKLDKSALLCPMIDARRMEVYTALYDGNMRLLKPVEAMVIDEHSFEQELSEHEIYFFGNGAMKCAEVIKSKNAHFIEGIIPEAQYIGVLAEQTRRRHIEGSDLAYFDPLYVKEFVAAPSHVKGLK